MVFSTILLVWDIAFSPYGEAGRLTAPFAIALCFLAKRSLKSRPEEGARTYGSR